MKLYRNSSQQLTFSMDVEASSYQHLVDRVVERFELVPAGDRVQGLDVIFQEFASGELTVGLEWDSWVGFTVVAKSTNSEGLVEEIARFLES